MKNFKVLLMVAGLSTSLVASENHNLSTLYGKFSEKFAALTQEVMNKSSKFASEISTKGNDYIIKPLSDVSSNVVSKASHVTTAVLNAGNENVIQPVSKVTSNVIAAILNSSAAKTASEFGSTIVSKTSEVASNVSTKVADLNTCLLNNSSDIATIVSNKANDFGAASAEFYAKNETAVKMTAAVVTVVTVAGLLKYYRDGYLFSPSNDQKTTAQ